MDTNRTPTIERQTMKTEELLECFALFYRCPRPETWAQLEHPDTWQRFTDTIRDSLKGQFPSRQFLIRRPSGNPPPPKEPLSRWLFGETGLRFAERDLSRAPHFEEHLNFARAYLAHDMPTGAAPIESLYRCWPHGGHGTLSHVQPTGLYNGNAAAHMASLLEEYGCPRVEDASLPPDHLAVELGFLALLIQYGDPIDIRQFIDDHLSWLPSYVDALFDQIPHARIFIALTILLNAYLEKLRLS
jgi:hypothetical protein